MSLTDFLGVFATTRKIFSDDRGWFSELWQEDRLDGLPTDLRFSQDNVSISHKGVVRGLHFQNPHGQGKLLTVVSGRLFDVGLDLRQSSPTFGKFFSIELSAERGEQIYIPPGFAHGFCALDDDTLLVYKCSSKYHGESEHTVLWNDPDINIPWPLSNPIVSEKDQNGTPFSKLPKGALFP